MPDKPDPRRLSPQMVVQMMNSHPSIGTVLSISRLRKHRLIAGFQISSDGETIDLMRYIAWLAHRRHAARKGVAGGDTPSKVPRKLGPAFTGKPPAFG